MKRALLFLLIFIGVVCGTYALVIGTNFSAIQVLRENQKGMADGAELIQSTTSLKALTKFIARHPEFVSITSYNLEDPDSGIFYQEDVPRSLGTTANIFLLIEYERQVLEEILNRDEQIHIDEIDIYSLPQVNQSNHHALREKLGKSASLDAIVSQLIIHNDISAADYLWFRLGEVNLKQLITDLGFSTEAMPVPFSGMYISINPAFSDTANLNSGNFPQSSIRNAQKLKDDADFRNQVKDAFRKNRLSISFMQERDALRYFPQSTTKEMAQLMGALLNGEIISEELSANILDKLRWPENADPAIKNSFEKYGAVYEDRMGLLGGIDFGTSIFDNHTSVQAVYFDRLPVAFWLHMSANHMNKDYQQRLIWDPALFESTLNEMESSHE